MEIIVKSDLNISPCKNSDLKLSMMKNVSLCVSRLFLKLIPLLMNRKRNSDMKWVIIIEFVKTIIWNGSHDLKDLI